MKSANFTARKSKARIIASIDDDDDDADTSATDTANPPASTLTADYDAPVFKRKSSSTKARKSLNRTLISLDDPHADVDGDNGTSSDKLAVMTAPLVVKKSTLSRQAIERNASSSSLLTTSIPTPKARPTTLLPSHSLSQLSLSASRPSYSKEALQQLKTSTPTTPLPLTDSNDDSPMLDAEISADPLDIASKFGSASTLSTPETSSIPTESTIKALKARRARAATSQSADDYISLSDPHSKNPGSRMSRIGDDGEEEILQTFVEDGGLALGRSATLAKERRRREDIRDAINLVEAPSDDSHHYKRDSVEGSDEETDSEDEVNKEWEANRIQTGGYGSAKRETLEEKIRKPPAAITPLPNFADALGRLNGILATMNGEREAKAKVVEELIAEREAIEKREKEVQEMLKVTSEKYELLRKEVGGAVHVGRGLESFGDDGGSAGMVI